LCRCRPRLRPEGIEQRLAKLHQELHRRFTRHLWRTRSHFSTRLATLRRSFFVAPDSLSQRLTLREIQIAQLVAQGLTNAAIGQNSGLPKILSNKH
jgi:DNA-binding NarL/FixJ family response regulator